MWNRRALREGVGQAAWSTRSTARLDRLGVERGGRDAPRARPQLGARPFHIKPLALQGEAGRELGTRAEPELRVDAREVALDRAIGDEEPARYLLVGEAFGDER